MRAFTYIDERRCGKEGINPFCYIGVLLFINSNADRVDCRLCTFTGARVNNTADARFNNDVACDVDYSDYFMMNVKVLFSEDVNGNMKIYGVYPHKSSVVLAGVVGQLSEATIEASYIVLNGTTYKFDSPNPAPASPTTDVMDTPLYNFNDKASESTLGAFYGAVVGGGTNAYKAAFSFKALDTNGTGKIDTVVVYPFTVHKATYVGTEQATMTTATACAAADDTAISLEDDVYYDGIAKNDWVKKTDAATKRPGADTYENIIQVNTFVFNAELAATSTAGEDYAVCIKAVSVDSYGAFHAKLMFSDGTIKDDENTTVYEVTYWDGAKEVTAIASYISAGQKAKGAIFQYTTDAKGRMVINAVTGLTLAKVTGFDGTAIQFAPAATKAAKVSSNTTVFYINSKDVKGVEGGEIRTSDGVNANVYYVDGTTAGGAAKFVVFDINNKMVGQAVTISAANPTADEINTALATFNTVTVTGTLPAADVKIPAGKTLVVSDDQTAVKLEAVAGEAGAALKLEADFTDATTKTTPSATTKFWATAGAKDTTNGTVVLGGSNKIPADTYVCDTAYFKTTNDGDTSVANVWVKNA